MEPGLFLDCVTALGIGFLGSLHCIGMCGPLVLAYSLQVSGSMASAPAGGARVLQSGLIHHLAFHLGRLATYGLLGALASLLFQIAAADRVLFDLRSVMTLAGGVLMVLMGLVLLRVIPLPGMSLLASSDSAGKVRLAAFIGSRSASSKVALGLAVGFLPCGLSWAMVVKAATTQNLPAGFLVMICFGLGTVPALLLPGISASFLSLRWRLMGERAAALSVIAMGLILVYKAAKKLL